MTAAFLEALCPRCEDGVTVHEAVEIVAAPYRESGPARCPVCGDELGGAE